MGLVYSSAKPTNFIIFTCVGIDPFNRNRVVCSYPTGYDLSNMSTFYYWNGSKVTLCTKDKFKVQRNNRISLELQLSAGARFVALLDANLAVGFDYLDRQSQVGPVYLQSSFEISNDSILTTLSKVYVFCENLHPFFSLKYPLVTDDVKFNAGIPSKTLNISEVVSNTFDNVQIVMSTAIALHNNAYVGNYSTLETIPLAQRYTSNKEGIFECVFIGALNFSTSPAGPWSSVLQVADILPLSSRTIYVRCGQSITVPEKLLQTIRVVSTEAI